MKPHRGTLILILGILGLIICMPVGIAAWVMGGNDLKEMAAGTMDPAGKDMTNVGRILGIVSVVLWVGGIVIALLMGGVSSFFGSAVATGTL
ncbi:MAG: hypothetical protein WA771_11655 [Chthoniobacterales bacterium]